MMPIPLDASGFENEDDARGPQRPMPGTYHVRVLRADDTLEKVDKVIVEFRVLAGTVPGQAGCEFTEFFGVASKDTDEKTAKMLERLRLFAMACKLLLPGEKKDVDFSEAEGRELIVAVDDQMSTKDGKKYCRIGWDTMWSLDHADVSGVPRGRMVEELDGGNESHAGELEEVEGGGGGTEWDDL